MKATFEIPEGHEIRGEVIRIYPTREQETKLTLLQQSLKTCWNWLCKQTQEVIDAREAYAVRYGLVAPKPQRPDYDSMSSAESKTAAEAHREAVREWSRRVYEATDKIPECSWRPKFKDMIALYSSEERPLKHDYQLLREVILGNLDEPLDIMPSAHLLQALVHTYFHSGRAAGGKGRAKNQRRKRFRRREDDMPLLVRSGDCFRLGDFTPKYERPGQHRSYNCQISFEGMKFLGKLPGRKPTGRVMQGVAISQQADGWYASVKQVVPIRQLLAAIPGSVVGVSMGLDDIAATSDGRILSNPRNHELSRQIAQMQSLESVRRPSADCTTVGRLHQKMKRRVMHQLYNELIKPLATVETIKVEASSSDVGHLPHDWDGKASNQVSVMRLGPALLKQRFGSRVREVECSDISVTCSQCGERSKESFGYRDDPMCKCANCGAEIHRRINAARNVVARAPKLLETCGT